MHFFGTIHTYTSYHLNMMDEDFVKVDKLSTILNSHSRHLWIHCFLITRFLFLPNYLSTYTHVTNLLKLKQQTMIDDAHTSYKPNQAEMMDND